MKSLRPIYSKHVVSKRERKRIVALMEEKLVEAVDLVKKAEKVEVAKLRVREATLILLNGIPAIVVEGELVYPTLVAAYRLGLKLPTIVVDMGAVPHILNGADVMVPGIVKFDEFEKGGIVYIADEEKLRIFAVGEALISSEELATVNRGKAVRTLHYAGGKLWELVRRFPTSHA